MEGNFHHIVDGHGTRLATLIPDMRGISHAQFVTSDEDEIQVGSFTYNAPHKVKKHIHNELPRTISRTQEFLYIQEGAATVSIYDVEGVIVETVTLHKHSGLVIFQGWHDAQIDEHCQFFEVKLGPYMGVNDKRHDD